MEFLFFTNISINNKNALYHVCFHHEKYVFLPDTETETKENDLPSFSFKRENDEWHEHEKIAPDVKDQAIDALENYLLKQH